MLRLLFLFIMTVFAVFVFVFANLNYNLITINYIAGVLNLPLAVALVVSFLLGVTLSAISFIVPFTLIKLKNKSLEQQVQNMTEQLTQNI